MALTGNLGVGAGSDERGLSKGYGSDSVVTLDGQRLPGLAPEWAATVLKEGFEGSVVGRVIPSEPMPLTGKDIPVYDSEIEVGLVGEAQAKPQVTPGGFSVRPMRSAKVAGIAVVSKEVADVNPLRMLELTQNDMRNAISRAVDSLVLFNRDLRGNVYTGVNVPVVGGENTDVYIGDGPVTADNLLDAYDAIVNNRDDVDPNGWVFDTRQRARLARLLQEHEDGLPNLRAGVTSVAGLPAYFSRAFARVAKQDPTQGNLVGILGDFSKVRWGFVERLDIQRSTEATVGGVSMFETNQIALLIEATLGWTTLDQAAFATIRTGTEPTEG